MRCKDVVRQVSSMSRDITIGRWGVLKTPDLRDGSSAREYPRAKKGSTHTCAAISLDPTGVWTQEDGSQRLRLVAASSSTSVKRWRRALATPSKSPVSM